MPSNERRIELTGPEAKLVYEELVHAEGGDCKALGVYIRQTSVRGQRPTITPTLTREAYKQVKRILKGSRNAK